MHYTWFGDFAIGLELLKACLGARVWLEEEEVR